MIGMFYREAFRCTDILDRFLAGEEPTVTEFKDALFLTERANDRSKPGRLLSRRVQGCHRGVEDLARCHPGDSGRTVDRIS